MGAGRRDLHRKARQEEPDVEGDRIGLCPAGGRRHGGAVLSPRSPGPMLSPYSTKVEPESVYAANRVLAAITKLFNWALLRGLLTTSPIVAGMARDGEVTRSRFLGFDEIRIVWKAAGRLGDPFGPFYRLLLVTAQRRGEVACARWTSLDLERERLWTMTPEETKAGREHFVPLTDPAAEIFAAQPMISNPDLDPETTNDTAVFVFTATGRTPLSGYSKASVRLTRRSATSSARKPKRARKILRRRSRSSVARARSPPHCRDAHGRCARHSAAHRGIQC